MILVSTTSVQYIYLEYCFADTRKWQTKNKMVNNMAAKVMLLSTTSNKIIKIWFFSIGYRANTGVKIIEVADLFGVTCMMPISYVS